MADEDTFMVRCTVALQGVKYDLNHLSQLPPTAAGGSTFECVQYAVTREGRFPYVVFAGSVVLLVLCLALTMRRRY